MRLSPRPVRRSRFGASGLALAIALAAAACAARLSSIRLEGTPEDLTQLVGSWSGDYISDTSLDRGGSIIFRLQAGEERASGDVLMTRQGARHAYEPYDPEHGIVRSLGAKQSLAIRFVKARDGGVTGELDPYWDLDRECEARTVFHGTIRGNVIQGTYETTFRGTHQRAVGKWRVAKAEPVIK
jgi:nitrous oxidase accessory protein NosD